MSRIDKSRQARELSIEQLNAIELLITGMSDGEVAEAVGVSRQTVCEWRNQDAEFKAKLERKRQDVWRVHEDNLRALVSQAIDILKQNMSSQDERVKMAAAVHVLRSVGLYGQSLEPVGATSAESILLKDWAF